MSSPGSCIWSVPQPCWCCLGRWRVPGWSESLGTGLSIELPNPISCPLSACSEDGSKQLSHGPAATGPTALPSPFLQNTSPNKDSLPWLASCRVFGLIGEKSNKNELLPVSMCFSLPQKLHHILLSVLWVRSVSKGMCSPLRSPFCPAPPFVSHYPHPKLTRIVVRIILHSSRTTLHCFSNCRLRRETNAAHYNQNYICNGNKANSPENVREHHT